MTSTPSPGLRDAACCGGATRSTRCFMEHMEECRLCHTAVRWDLINHRLFGFRASCDYPAEGGA